MISQREKGIYLAFCAAQLVGAVLFYGVFYTLNDQLRVGWLSAPHSYLQLLTVMVLSLAGEMATRPLGLRLEAGRTGHRLAMSLARRQSLWLAAGFGIFLALTRDERISRWFLVGLVVATFPLFYATSRCGRRWLFRLFPSAGRQMKLRALLLGTPAWCAVVQNRLEEFPGYFKIQPPLPYEPEEPTESILQKIEERSPDLLLFSSRDFPDETVSHFFAMGDRRGFRCWIPVEMSMRHGRQFESQNLGGLTVLSPPTFPLAMPHNRALKRAFDIAVSTVVIPLIVLPLMVLVAFIQRLHSPGPLFFRQDRVGENGQIFRIFKFRTMRLDNDDEGRQATSGDARIYRGGQWLRKLSLDEFPQFFNVLRGEMSAVGPRPHMVEHERKFEKFHELYGSRRFVKPGVTGLAQVEGYRGEIRGTRDVRGRARYDLFYVRHWSLGLDIRLAMQTVLHLIHPQTGAY